MKSLNCHDMMVETAATRGALKTIIQRDFAGSETDFSKQCGLDAADTFRVVTGVGPATLFFVRRAAAALKQDSASELITAFLSDVVTGVTDSFSAVVTLKAARRSGFNGVSIERRETGRPNDSNNHGGGESLFTHTLVEIAKRRSGIAAARCRLVFAHLNTATLLRSRLHGVLARHQLSDLQFAALVVLFALEPEPTPTAALAEHTAVSRAAMTDALDKLQALGFVTRTRDRCDRRVIYVRITNAGQETVGDATDNYLSAVAHTARHLDDRDYHGLSAAYLELLRGVTGPDEPARRSEPDAS